MANMADDIRLIVEQVLKSYDMQALLGASPAGQYGVSTGLLATARNVGMTLGVGVGAFLYAGFGAASGARATLGAVRPAFAAIAAIAISYAAVRIPAPQWRAKIAAFCYSDRS